MLILKMKALKPRCLRHYSGKKKIGSPFFVKTKRKKKYSLWKLPSSILLTIYSGFMIIKPRESAEKGYTCNISAPARDLNHLQSILKLRTSFVPLLLCHEWTGRYLFGKLFQQQKIPHFLFTLND